jgi:hypothetical protein
MLLQPRRSSTIPFNTGGRTGVRMASDSRLSRYRACPWRKRSRDNHSVAMSSSRGFAFHYTFFTCRLRRRTPGPPPFSSINSTPAPSARRTAKSLATVSDVWSSANSARRIVFRPNAASRARSSTVHLRIARAARRAVREPPRVRRWLRRQHHHGQR